MNKKPVELYLIGGAAGFLSGVLMLVSSYIIVARLQDAALGTPALKLVGVTHGLSVVSLILIVPTVIALFVSLNGHRDSTQLPWACVLRRCGWP